MKLVALSAVFVWSIGCGPEEAVPGDTRVTRATPSEDTDEQQPKTGAGQAISNEAEEVAEASEGDEDVEEDAARTVVDLPVLTIFDESEPFPALPGDGEPVEAEGEDVDGPGVINGPQDGDPCDDGNWCTLEDALSVGECTGYPRYWEKTYGTASFEDVGAFIDVSDGGYALVGSAPSSSSGYADLWLVRISEAGNVLFEGTLAGTAHSFVVGAVETEGGFSVLTCTPPSDDKVCTLKLFAIDTQGTLVGATPLPFFEAAYGVGKSAHMVGLPQGGLGVVTTEWKDDPASSLPYQNPTMLRVAVVEEDTSLKWQSFFMVDGSIKANALTLTTNDDLVVTGYVDVVAAKLRDVFWARVNAATGAKGGLTIWGDAGNDEAFSVIEAHDGGLLITGTMGVYSPYSGNLLFVFHEDAQQENSWWQSYVNGYGGYSNGVGLALRALTDGSYAVGGTVVSATDWSLDLWLLKVGSYGELLWNVEYGGQLPDVPVHVFENLDGGLTVGGYTQSKGAGQRDGWVLKLNGNGTFDCAE